MLAFRSTSNRYNQHSCKQSYSAPFTPDCGIAHAPRAQNNTVLLLQLACYTPCSVVSMKILVYLFLFTKFNIIFTHFSHNLCFRLESLLICATALIAYFADLITDIKVPTR